MDEKRGYRGDVKRLAFDVEFALRVADNLAARLPVNAGNPFVDFRRD